MALAETTVLLASSGEGTKFAVLVDGIAKPVDAWVTADSLVSNINHDDLKVLVGRILAHPVGVEDAETTALAASTFLSNRAEGALKLELVDTHVGWLTHGGTLWYWALATTTLNSNTVNHIALLGLVTETTRLVWASWTSRAMDRGHLAELPSAETKKKSEKIRLLLLVKLLDVFVAPHDYTF
jgi:hypothetical protein